MSDLSHGGYRTDECITGSRRLLAMWTLWVIVGRDTPRDSCCLRRLGFGSSATSDPSTEAGSGPAGLTCARVGESTTG